MQSPRERARRLERVLVLSEWKHSAAQQRRDEVARALAFARSELEQLAELGTRVAARATPQLAPLLLAAAHKRRSMIAGLIARLEQQALAEAAECTTARRRTEIVRERLAAARRLDRDRQGERQLGEDVLRRAVIATPGQASASMVGGVGAPAGRK